MRYGKTTVCHHEAPSTAPVGACCPRVPSPALPPPVPLKGGAPPVPVQPKAQGCAFAHMGPRSPLRHINMPPLRFWSYGHCPPWFVRAPVLWGLLAPLHRMPSQYKFCIKFDSMVHIATLCGYMYYSNGSLTCIKISRSWGLSAPCRLASPECFS